MIEGLKISNFQSHPGSSLEFSPGVNTLVGDSDCGKSAVMRALLWVITNQPQGDAHVSNWEKDKKGKLKGLCRVSVLVDAGTITRSRGKDENSYEYKPWDDASPVEAPSVRFEAMRSEVPQEIGEAFGIGPVNIQRQMDPPFLISATPGEAARYINGLVDLSEIDEAMSVTTSMSRETSADIKAANDSVARLEGEVSGLAWVGTLEKIATEAESLEGRLEVLKERKDSQVEALDKFLEASDAVARISRNLEKITEALDRLKRISGALDGAMAKYNRLNTAFREFQAAKRAAAGMDRVDKVSWLLDEARGFRGELEASRSILEAGKIPEFLEASRTATLDLEPLEGILSRARRMGSALAGSRESLEKSLNDLSNFGTGLAIIEKADAEIREIYRDLEGKVCPCCGRPMHGVEK